MTHTVEGFAHISPLTSMKPRSISTHHQKTRINNTQKFSSVHEFFESPLSQIERFDQKFSKTGVRQFKYPNIYFYDHYDNFSMIILNQYTHNLNENLRNIELQKLKYQQQSQQL